MRHKSEVHARLKEFLAEVNTFGHVIQGLLSDNGGEFDNEQVRNTLKEFGIKQMLTMPYTPEQNGSAERENRTIVEMSRALMHAHNEIPNGLWAEISKAAVYILNRTGPTPVDGKSPHQLWYNKKPKINHLRIIGCNCYVHIPKQKRLRKLENKAEKGILIGYDGDEGYRVYDVKNLKLMRSRDVVFDEKSLLEKRKIDKPPEKPNVEPVGNKTYVLPIPSANCGTDDNSHLNSHIEANGRDENIESFREDNERDENEIEATMGRQLRDRSRIKPPERFNFEEVINEAISVSESSLYQKVLNSPEKDKWIEAMNKEINSLYENETLKMTDLLKNRKGLQCK